MRVSFGGGNGRRGHGGPRISFELGPIGSIVVSVFLIIVGAFLVLISFGNIIPLITGIIIIVLGVVSLRHNKKKLMNEKYSDKEK